MVIGCVLVISKLNAAVVFSVPYIGKLNLLNSPTLNGVYCQNVTVRFFRVQMTIELSPLPGIA